MPGLDLHCAQATAVAVAEEGVRRRQDADVLDLAGVLAKDHVRHVFGQAAGGKPGGERRGVDDYAVHGHEEGLASDARIAQFLHRRGASGRLNAEGDSASSALLSNLQAGRRLGPHHVEQLTGALSRVRHVRPRDQVGGPAQQARRLLFVRRNLYADSRQGYRAGRHVELQHFAVFGGRFRNQGRVPRKIGHDLVNARRDPLEGEVAEVVAHAGQFQAGQQDQCPGQRQAGDVAQDLAFDAQQRLTLDRGLGARVLWRRRSQAEEKRQRQGPADRRNGNTAMFGSHGANIRKPPPGRQGPGGGSFAVAGGSENLRHMVKQRSATFSLTWHSSSETGMHDARRATVAT